MINDFKKFIARGNLLDLSIGFIMGAAFTAIVKTLTDGIIMPLVAVLTGGIDFKSKVWDISGTIPADATSEQIQAAVKAGTPVILYGQFINDIITFLIVAIVMFFLARYAINIFKAMEAEAETPPQEALLTEIRDILKSK